MSAGLLKKTILTLIILTLSANAGENNVSELLEQLVELSPEINRIITTRYSDTTRAFNEHYLLTADFRLFGLKIGQMTLGEVIISNKDSFSITYNPPFEKWDTQYLSYWQGNSIFIDEVISQEPEKYIYKKADSAWILIDYLAENPRENKTALFQQGMQANSVNLVEFTQLLFQRQFTDIREVLFLAESYRIQLEKSAALSELYSIYELKWNVRKGEERVRLNGVHLLGLETDSRYIPLAGILEVSFVGLLDVNLTGIIQFDSDTE